MSWFYQSTVAMLLAVPVYILISFFGYKGIRPEIILGWYFFGNAITALLFSGRMGTIIPSLGVVSILLLLGVTIGGASNIFYFRALANENTPNPGLPVAIANAASVFVFLFSILLSKWLPGYFKLMKLDLWALAGIVLTVIGISIIAVRR